MNNSDSNIQGDPTRVLAVVGPTAVGKTWVAEQCALRLRGEVISADSMQVYRGLDIGTDKSPLESRPVTYHLIDVVEPGEQFSAACYQSLARLAIAECAQRGALPIVCGGTGLYVRAALDDLAFPAGDQCENPVRQRWEAHFAGQGAEALHRELEARDPASAELIHPNNVRRVIRALELYEQGESYATRHEGLKVRRSVYDTRFVGLIMERERLYRRIDERVDRMIDRGLVGEVEALLERGFRTALTAAQAIGYKEMVEHLDGGCSLDEAIARIKQASRRYAKRQLTWFNADPRITWIDVTELSPADAVDAVVHAVESPRDDQ